METPSMVTAALPMTTIHASFAENMAGSITTMPDAAMETAAAMKDITTSELSELDFALHMIDYLW
jgi:hypothetical protein